MLLCTAVGGGFGLRDYYSLGHWRARGVSETLSGVTQLKIGDVCLLVSEQSERDSISGGQCKIGYMFDVCIYIYVWIVRM